MSSTVRKAPEEPQFQIAPLHPLEEERIRSLHELNILDSDASKRFDRITTLTADLFNVPICLISLVDTDRQWFLSRFGLQACETGRDAAFCAHALHEDAMLVVEDTHLDPRFAGNPLVVDEPNIRFYAGAVIRDDNNLPLGTLCIIGQQPRPFSADDRRRLGQLAQLAQAELLPIGDSTADRARAQLSAQVDPLTKARWQQAFYDIVDGVLDDENKQGVRFALINIQNMQFFNQVFGRLVGDEILMGVAHRLSRVCRSLGHVELGRIGGQQMAVLITEAAANTDIKDTEKAIVEAMGTPVHTKAGPLSPDIHIGLSDCVGDVRSHAEVLERCRVAMDSASGRSGIVSAVFCEEQQQTFVQWLKVAADIRTAIDKNAFNLVYQPKVHTTTGKLAGLECLLRWKHAGMGHISPPQILTAAAKMNLTERLERWVIETTVKQMAAWRNSGLAYGSVSVNVTGVTLLAPDFCDWLSGVMHKYDVPAGHLDLEVVESSIFNDFKAIVSAMMSVRKLGVTFSLDDFGTGYSSLAYLKQLPVCTVKIDKAFVDNIIEDQSAAGLCAGIITIARDLGLAAVAEGVETEQQYLILRAYRCEVLQGYYFSKPLDAEATAKLLQPDSGPLRPVFD